MKTRIIRIGNSRGVRIPKTVLEQTGLRGDVEMMVEGNCLVIAAVKRPRAGWQEAFKTMASHGDDALLDGNRYVPTSWEKDEWEWR